MDEVRLEMKNVRIDFKTYEGDPKKLVGYQEITGHIVFDIKLGKTSGKRQGSVPMDIRPDPLQP